MLPTEPDNISSTRIRKELTARVKYTAGVREWQIFDDDTVVAFVHCEDAFQTEGSIVVGTEFYKMLFDNPSGSGFQLERLTNLGNMESRVAQGQILGLAGYRVEADSHIYIARVAMKFFAPTELIVTRDGVDAGKIRAKQLFSSTTLLRFPLDMPVVTQAFLFALTRIAQERRRRSF